MNWNGSIWFLFFSLNLCSRIVLYVFVFCLFFSFFFFFLFVCVSVCVQESVVIVSLPLLTKLYQFFFSLFNNFSSVFFFHLLVPDKPGPVNAEQSQLAVYPMMLAFQPSAGVVSYYQIHIWEEKHNFNATFSSYNASNGILVFTDLLPFQSYAYSLYAFNENGDMSEPTNGYFITGTDWVLNYFFIVIINDINNKDDNDDD